MPLKLISSCFSIYSLSQPCRLFPACCRRHHWRREESRGEWEYWRETEKIFQKWKYTNSFVKFLRFDYFPFLVSCHAHGLIKWVHRSAAYTAISWLELSTRVKTTREKFKNTWHERKEDLTWIGWGGCVLRGVGGLNLILLDVESMKWRLKDSVELSWGVFESWQSFLSFLPSFATLTNLPAYFDIFPAHTHTHILSEKSWKIQFSILFSRR